MVIGCFTACLFIICRKFMDYNNNYGDDRRHGSGGFMGAERAGYRGNGG